VLEACLDPISPRHEFIQSAMKLRRLFQRCYKVRLEVSHIVLLQKSMNSLQDIQAILRRDGT
jgi:hypothetical protein